MNKLRSRPQLAASYHLTDSTLQTGENLFRESVMLGQTQSQAQGKRGQLLRALEVLADCFP